MPQRKQYLIDREFQLKTTFSIVGIVTLISCILILGVASFVVYNNVKNNDILKIQDNIIEFLNSRIAKEEKNLLYRDTLKEITQNHINNTHTLKEVIFYNNILLIAIIVFTVFQAFILYFLVIRKTHRISGPLYLMKNYMKEIIRGGEPSTRPLREKDELKEFYEIFEEMVETLKKQQKH